MSGPFAQSQALFLKIKRSALQNSSRAQTDICRQYSPSSFRPANANRQMLDFIGLSALDRTIASTVPSLNFVLAISSATRLTALKGHGLSSRHTKGRGHRAGRATREDTAIRFGTAPAG